MSDHLTTILRDCDGDEKKQKNTLCDVNCSTTVDAQVCRVRRDGSDWRYIGWRTSHVGIMDAPEAVVPVVEAAA